MNQKGFALIFILIGLLVLICVGGIYYLNQKKIADINPGGRVIWANPSVVSLN